MKIEKLKETYLARSSNEFTQDILNKINQLIDATNRLERIRETHTDSFLNTMKEHRERLDKLEAITNKSEDSEILDCPWCGVTGQVKYDNIEEGFIAYCENGECNMRISQTFPYETRQEAIKNWNKRT